jgi:hypothetical protein
LKRYRFFFAFWLVGLFFWLNALAFAVPGDLDLTFGSGGIVTTAATNFQNRPSSIQIQPYGKIIVSGYSYHYDYWEAIDYVASSFIARYNPSGTLDVSFGTNGIVNTSEADANQYLGWDLNGSAARRKGRQRRVSMDHKRQPTLGHGFCRLSL